MVGGNVALCYVNIAASLPSNIDVVFVWILGWKSKEGLEPPSGWLPSNNADAKKADAIKADAIKADGWVTS